MRKALYGSLLALSIVSLASCSSEDEYVNNDGDGVRFTVRIPGNLATRGTFGDGTDNGDRATLNNLQWTVFEVEADGSLAPVFSDLKKDAFGASQTDETVTIALAKGKTYKVAFYADDNTNNFVEYADGKIKVNYLNATSNTAAEDAFIGQSKEFTVSGAYNEEVVLTRPFAQLNWGTDDTAEKSILPLIENGLTGSVTVSSGLYSTMDVISGEVGNPVKEDVTFSAVNFNSLPKHDFPIQKEEEDAVPYKLIAMNYLLTGDGTIDCSLNFNNDLTSVEVNSAPVKVNYRTNIFGSLLTAPGNFNITVNNNFENDDNNIDIAEFISTQTDLDNALQDGQEVIYLNPGSYELKSGLQTAQTVKIIGMNKEKTVLKLNGSVYFNGKSISLEKLTYSVPTGLTYNEFAFGFLQRVQDLTLTDCIVNGGLRLNVNGTANIEGCVFNVEVSGGFDGYPLFYYAATGSTVNVKNCEFNSKGKGIVMYNEAATVYAMNVTDCKFTSTNPATDKAAIQMHTERGISGTLNISGCTATGFVDKNNGLWNEVNNTNDQETDVFDITVDGVLVH